MGDGNLLIMNQASQLTAAFSGHQAAVRASLKARAQGAASALQSRFAAVMGPAIDKVLKPSKSQAWSIPEQVSADSALQQGIAGMLPEGAERVQVNSLVSAHLERILNECARIMHNELNDVTLSSLLSSLPSEVITGRETSVEQLRGIDIESLKVSKPSESAVDRTDRELMLTSASLLRAIDAQLSGSAAGAPGMSAARKAAIDTYESQLSFITNKAKDLRFSDLAREGCVSALNKLRDGWEGEPRLLFADPQYRSLHKEMQSIAKERVLHELELQSHFDHHAQGASHSESVRPERVPLKIANDLQSAMAGFRQIQLVDLYCLSRGNEMWAIIPSLLRVGHDIDPIQCMHWKPSIEDIPEGLRPYYEEQSRAFAQKLLALVPSMRSTLLAEHTHGTSKTAFQPSEDDGVAIYWAMVQLYHPLSREHRRTLEAEIIAFPPKFAHGNPNKPLEKLREKLQEALDIMLRLRWDTIAIPLIDILGQRDPLFTVELAKHRDLPNDPDDSAVEMGKLLRDVTQVIDTLDHSGKHWDQNPAKALRAAESRPNKELEAISREVKSLKQALNAGGIHGKGGDQSRGKCQVKGCHRKIEGFTAKNQWKVCGTCLLNYRSTGKPLNLIDGTTWGKEATNKAFNAMKREVNFAKLKQKLKRANKARAKRERPSEVDEEPERSLGGQDGLQNSSSAKKARAVKFAKSVEELRSKRSEFLSLP